jgi:hypothetical protein
MNPAERTSERATVFILEFSGRYEVKFQIAYRSGSRSIEQHYSQSERRWGMRRGR